MTERDQRVAIDREQARLQLLFGLSRTFAERANTAAGRKLPPPFGVFEAVNYASIYW